MNHGAFKHSSVETVKGGLYLVYSSFGEENGTRIMDIESAGGSSDSSDDPENDEYQEEAEDQDFDSGSDSSQEEEEEEEEDGRIVLVSVKDSKKPASKIAGGIKLHKCSSHEDLLKAIRKIWAKYTKEELHGEADSGHVFENVWPGYTLKYYSYEEKLLPTPNVMDWWEVADLLGSILAEEGEEEEEENTISINLVNEEGNLENVGSVNLDECHDHRDLVASVHCAWVKYTGDEPVSLDTINESTAWPGFKVTYLRQCNAGSSVYYPFDPWKMSWTDVDNLLYKILVKKEEKR